MQLLPMFASLAQTLSRLMLFRAGPQDLPGGQGVMQLAVVAYLLSTAARLTLINPVFSAFAQALLSLGVLWVYLRIILNWRKVPERIPQTLTALLFKDIVIGIMMLGPLSVLTPVLLAIADGGDLQNLQVPAFAAYAWLGLSLWGLTLAGHIFRNALDCSLGMGIAVAFGYELVLIMTISVLGVPGAGS